MLNFEQIKHELLYEKERLELIIEAQKDLLEIMKPMDKKMYNCRIPEHIEKAGKYRAYISDWSYDKKRKDIERIYGRRADACRHNPR